MTVLEAQRPAAGTEASGGLTLDAKVSGAWEGLSARAPVACPVCASTMRALPAGGGECSRCGSTLT
jgi:hypothetical protein